jgi:hypothetical protein
MAKLSKSIHKIIKQHSAARASAVMSFHFSARIFPASHPASIQSIPVQPGTEPRQLPLANCRGRLFTSSISWMVFDTCKMFVNAVRVWKFQAKLSK